MPSNDRERLIGVINEACRLVENDRSRLMDVLLYIQKEMRCISNSAMELIAKKLNCHRVEIEGMSTFYAFFSNNKKGKISIRLCTDIVDQYSGAKDIEEVLSDELNLKLGETSSDGMFSIDETPCIGMCDQAPAAMINDTIFTNLTPNKTRKILKQLRNGTPIEKIVTDFGDGQNKSKLIHSMVNNNIKLNGDVLFSSFLPNVALRKAITLLPNEIISIIKDSKLRGRGGAGFPTAMKWQSSSDVAAKQKYIICNADEGEPGTFKDRVLLTERPDLLFEGMTIASYAVGATEGIIYLRGEYAYLLAYLENILDQRRQSNLLGKNIAGKQGFDFDIRIQLGAGAYICGEESSLISSCEGLRGEPKNRPPFPAQSGYLGRPTVVNNVETLCCVPKIIDKGAKWFASMGTKESTGTKLISISGDCDKPGVYEIPFGLSVREMLKLAEAKDVGAVVMGGPSGEIISIAELDQKIAFEDLATGGAIIVFNSSRNILEIVSYYMEFFVDESCGYCTPCRVGNVFLTKNIEKIRAGQACQEDMQSIHNLCNSIIMTSRCGLGKTSPNPIISTMKHFPMVYSTLLKESSKGLLASFDIQGALEESRHIAKRRSLIYDPSWD